MTLRYLDIFLPGPNGLNVELWRIYNSKILKDKQDGQSWSIQAEHLSWVGIGWTMHMGRLRWPATDWPIIEFPDGRLEQLYQDNYGIGTHITKDFLKYDKDTYKLCFKDGVIWTFGASSTLTLGDGSSVPVRLVTRIENAYGHYITVAYSSGKTTMSTITDSMGRVITFVKAIDPERLTQVKVKNATGGEVIYSYSVGTFGNGYTKLQSFTPPCLPAAAFTYYDGSSDHYELTKVTTSYGSEMEFSYADQDFYFNTTHLLSRVVYQKKIKFNSGEAAKVWTFTYPRYDSPPDQGTVSVQGPEYTINVTHYAYQSALADRWKLGLISSRSISDGSYSESYEWTYQQISDNNWWVLSTDMGDAKGPLISSVTRTPIGDAASREEYLYERTDPKQYGLPTKIKHYNNSGSLKSYKELTYYYESSTGFRDRNMLAFLKDELQRNAGGTLVRDTITTYFEESNKWGAVKRISRFKSPGAYYAWDYGYTCSDPTLVTVTIDNPGSAGVLTVNYTYGVQKEVIGPEFTVVTRNISSYDSSVTSETNQHDGTMTYSYDDLGRVTAVSMPGNDASLAWRPNGENKVVITRGANTVTKFWDGIGRDTGYTESGDGTTLYFRKTLDAEGRIKEENQGSVNASHKYVYVLNAAGQATQIKDPVNEITNISYAGTLKTVTDPEAHATVFRYDDLPGLPTKVTDAQSHVADHTYDSMGRLTSAIYNGTRTHSFAYDGVDNVTSETHPETGAISYTYDPENRLYQKTWGGATITYLHNPSNQLFAVMAGDDSIDYEYDTHGRVKRMSGASGWSREVTTYNSLGSVLTENLTFPGLPQKQITYEYDLNNILKKVTYPDGKSVTITNNGLNVPETATFNGQAIVNAVSYGPNKMPSTMTLGNGTSLTATFYNSGLLNTTSLKKGANTLYNASYTYDGVGNVLSISSTIPSLSASFGYDSLNRLTSATYSTGRVGAFIYEYDEYGNMKTVKENGNPVFSKTYNSNNRITGYTYDSRGNLTSAGAGSNTYVWNNQNQLQEVRTTSGQILGKYVYDAMGRRLMAIPANPEMNIKLDTNDIPDGGSVSFICSPGSHIDKTFTIQNLGDANLNLTGSPKVAISGQHAALFTVQQQPSTPVSPQGTTTFVIRFAPDSQGAKTAALSIANDDVDENPYNITLKGNSGPEINILEAPDGGAFDFGTVMIHDSWPQTFTIQNLGDADLTLSGSPIVFVQGPDRNDFFVTQQPASVIPPQGSTTFVIMFSPSLPEGQKTASIAITNNDYDESPYDIALLGTAEIAPPKAPEKSKFDVTFPDGGEELLGGIPIIIAWTGGPPAQDVKIEYSTDNGTSYTTIAERAPNTGSYEWPVPQDISPACLIRISNADGVLAVPQILSYDLSFKIDEPEGPAPLASLFTIRAGVPDRKTQALWSADISFVPDASGKKEKMFLSYGVVECPGGALFLGTWHRLRVRFDLDSYLGSVWLDEQLMFEDAPLSVEPFADGEPEIEISVAEGWPAKVWVEDLEVRFQDQRLKLQSEDGLTVKPLLRESFERYELGLFPHKGGWQRVREEPQRVRQRTGRAQEGKEGRRVQDSEDKEWEIGRALVDGEEFHSGSRSFRLDSSERMAVSVMKRFSLPDRIPFDVSEDCFAIVLSEGISQTTETEFDASGRELGERKGGGRGKREVDRSSGRRERSGDRQRLSDEETTAAGSSNLARAEVQGDLRTLSASGGGSYYIYSFNGLLLAEYDISGNCVRDYIYLCGQLVAEYRPQGGQYYYYTSDQINSTRIVTNNSGTVVYSAAYDPYGGIQKTWTSTYTPTLKFSGKERDGESGLDYFGARYYDKAQYRFISVDPIMARTAALFDPQLWHLYSYCRNSPVTFFDPEGKQPVFIRVVRDYYGNHMTLGTIYADGIRFGTTQELPYRFNAEYISCIELGLYAAWVARSPGLGYPVIWLEDKNGRTWVQIHPFGKKLEGCIGMVGRSNFDKLMAYIALRQASYVSTVLAGVEFEFPPIIFMSVENDTLRPVVSTNYFLGTYSDLLMLIWYVWTFLR